MSKSFIGANTKITDFCIINNNVSINHDCRLDNFSSLAPTLATGGNVAIEKRTAIGIAL